MGMINMDIGRHNDATFTDIRPKLLNEQTVCSVVLRKLSRKFHSTLTLCNFHSYGHEFKKGGGAKHAENLSEL
jgi:hypothetical protein